MSKGLSERNVLGFTAIIKKEMKLETDQYDHIIQQELRANAGRTVTQIAKAVNRQIAKANEQS